MIWLTDKTSQATVGYALLSVYKLNIFRSVTSTGLRHSQLQVGNYLCSWTEEEPPSIAQSTSGSSRSVAWSRGSSPSRTHGALISMAAQPLGNPDPPATLWLVAKYLRNASARRNSSGGVSVLSHDTSSVIFFKSPHSPHLFCPLCALS